MRLMSAAAVAFAASSLIAAPQLSAQLSPHFTIAAGLAAPTGNFGNGVDMGYNATVGLGLSAPLVPVGVRFEGMYQAVGFSSPATGTAKIMAGTVNATLSSVTMLPMTYLIGGLGMYHFSPVGPGVSANKVGFNVGVGLKIPLTGFGAHVEARYHYVSTSGSSTSFIPVTFGITF